MKQTLLKQISKSEDSGQNQHSRISPKSSSSLQCTARGTIYPDRRYPPTKTSDKTFVPVKSPSPDAGRLAAGAEIINKGVDGCVGTEAASAAALVELRARTRRPAHRRAVSLHGDTVAAAVRSRNDVTNRKPSSNHCRLSTIDDRVRNSGFDVVADYRLSVADAHVKTDFMDCPDDQVESRSPQLLLLPLTPVYETDSNGDRGCDDSTCGAQPCSGQRTACIADATKDDSQTACRLSEAVATSSLADRASSIADSTQDDSQTACRESEAFATSSVTDRSTDMKENQVSDVLNGDDNRVDEWTTTAASSSVTPHEGSPNLRIRSLRKSTSRRKRSDGSKSASPSSGGSPVLFRLNTSDSGTDDTTSNGDEGSGEEEEDDGVYDETFRYSSYKYIGDADSLELDSSSLDKVSEDDVTGKYQDQRFGSSSSESVLYNCSQKKNHHRSLSMTNSETTTKNGGSVMSNTLSKKIIKRHESMGAETYQATLERIYEVERKLILKKLDSVASYGFHLLGQNPMVISTVEPGSAAELGGVQVGDRLVTINGNYVVKAKQSMVVELVIQSGGQLELGVANGVLSRDICICCGYLNLKPDGIMKNWKRRWCQLKYDGFLYYFKTEDCTNPLGAISLSNYIIIRGIDCGRSNMFKLVKYGQKTYYIQTDNDEDMNRWAININMAASMANTQLCDTWLDISSHNVRLPALSIKNPECHGFLTKVGHRKKSWRRRYCVLKSACLYYYKDQTSSTAKGVVHLHGYSVEEETVYHRRFGFMTVPPVPQMRTFHFTAENETDMQRWIMALKTSIGKWVKVED